MPKLSNSLLLKQQQRLTASQIQLMQLIHLPAIALEQRIKEELEANPVLEDDSQSMEESLEQVEFKEEDAVNDIDTFFRDDDVVVRNYRNGERKEDSLFIAYNGFRDDLIFQLDMQNLSEEQYKIGEEIIGNIDVSGYLARSIDAIADDMLFRYNVETSNNEIEYVLSVIQSFEPAGIAARDLRECLLLQIERMNQQEQSIILAKQILEKCFLAFSNKQYETIMHKLNCDESLLQSAIDKIVSLNPKPASSQAEIADKITIVPDFILWQQNGRIEFTLNKFKSHSLHLSPFYQNMLADLNNNKLKNNDESIKFIKTKIESAKVFIDSIEQRANTLMRTMQAIVSMQYVYFIDGDITKLKPMRLADVAQKINMDISTVSRVVTNKYVQTPFGIFLLKDFFSNAIISDKAEAISAEHIKSIMIEAIENEDKMHPLNDEQLVLVLKNQGFTLARRTIAKYREKLNIPVARLRRTL
ncbi:MAG: RNA polymerase factor sigma-54 [Bacteroidales bacterium]|jgi:RNA polymerase sigma-54 factor|nr:RNA polymerase factor sigma-54 [Bacteroidales bacterium]